MHVAIARDRGERKTTDKFDRGIERDAAVQRGRNIVIRRTSIFLGRIAAEDLCKVLHMHARSIGTAIEKRAFFLPSDSGPAGTGTPSLGNARTAPGRFVPSAAKRSKSFPGLTDAAWCFSIASRSFSSGSKFAKNGGSAPRMGLGSR